MPGSGKMVGLFVENLLSQSSHLSNFDAQLPISYALRRKDKASGFSSIFQARPHKSLETRKDHLVPDKRKRLRIRKPGVNTGSF